MNALSYLCLFFIIVTIGLILFNNPGLRKNQFNDQYLSIPTFQSEKGIAAVMIVFHHLAQAFQPTGPAIILGYIGFIMVAVFFFTSGYGLAYGVQYKKEYLKGFFHKRFLPVLIPYWIVNTISILTFMIKGIFFPAYQYLLSYLGINLMFGYWFITALLFLYLFFWFSYTLGKKDTTHFFILTGLILIYIFVCGMMHLESFYTASVGGFLFGAFWLRIKDIILPWIRNHYIFKTGLILFAFCFTFAGRLVLSARGITSPWLHVPLRNVVSILFILSILAITQKIELHSKLLLWLGSISYELYLIHVFLLFVIPREQENVFVIGVLVGGLLLATILQSLDQGIIKWVKTR